MLAAWVACCAAWVPRRSGRAGSRVASQRGADSPDAPLETLSAKVQRTLLASTWEIQVPGPGAAREGSFFADRARAGQRALGINLDLLNWSAKREQRKGHGNSARQIWQQCIEIDQRDGRAWIALSKDAERSKRDPNLAAQLLVDSLRANPNSAYVRQAYGVLLERQGLWRKALDQYDRGLKCDAGHAASLVAKARLVAAHVPDGDAAARKCYEQALASEKNNCFALLGWADLEAKAGAGGAARALFQRAAKANPRNAATFVAWALFEEREPGADPRGYTGGVCRGLFATAHAAHPSSTRALTTWAAFEARQGNATGAAALLHKATRVQGHFQGGCTDATAFAKLGELVWAEQRDAKRARESFRRAVAVDATRAATYENWAAMEAAIGDAARARELLQQGIWGCASGVPDRNAVARLWLASGKLEANAALGIDPLAAATAAAAARRAYAAALDYASTVALEPLAAIIACTWATLERRLGDDNRARAVLEDRIETHPNDPSLWRALLQLEPADGRPATVVRQRARAALDGQPWKILSQFDESNAFAPPGG